MRRQRGWCVRAAWFAAMTVATAAFGGGDPQVGPTLDGDGDGEPTAGADLPNEICFLAELVGCGSITDTTIGSFGLLDVSSCGFLDIKDVWYRFVAPADGAYVIDTIGSLALSGGMDTVLSVFDGCMLTSNELACNDDIAFPNLDSAVKVFLDAGDEIKIRVAGWAGARGNFVLTIDCAVQGDECCDPWDNGRYDGRDAQTSQTGYGEDWRQFGRVTADDFWLCEGSVYKIRTVSGALCTDSLVPKADVIVYADCDGQPGEVLGWAKSIPELPGTITPYAQGTITIEETGEVTSNGFRIVNVTASFDKLILKGGAYWVSIYGFSGNADPDDQFFWGTSRGGVVQGRPGLYRDSEVGPEWSPVDDCCIGCTDFNFCVEGDTCKILLDNGGPQLADSGGVPGAASLQNGQRTADKVRSADQFVVPPCQDAFVCYVEAWVWTNCTRVGIDFYEGDCHCPQEAAPIATFETDCLIDSGISISGGLGVGQVRLVKAVFDQFPGRGVRVSAGRNVWLSAYALGDNRQNARGYFAFNADCERSCLINFDPACRKGPPFDSATWQPGNRDHAFLIAVATPDGEGQPVVQITPPTPVVPICPADINGDGSLSMQDLFDYLSHFFAGCP